MGGGIAQVVAQIAKKKVLLIDLNKAAVDKALAFMGMCSFLTISNAGYNMVWNQC